MAETGRVEFGAFFAASPVAMWIVEAESTRVVEVNDAAVRQYGYSREEHADMALADLVAPRERERFLCSLRSGETTGRWPQRRRDGSELWAKVVCQRLPAEGDPAWLVLAHDVSAQVEAQDALRRSETRFRSLIENATDVISVLDRNGVILYESPSAARALGYPPEEMVGRSALDFVHPDDVERTRKALAQALADHGGTHVVEYRIRHGDGSWRVREARGRNLMHVPEVGGLVVNSRDITERKEAEEAVRRAEERLRFALSASGVGVWDWDLASRRGTWSEEMFRLHGLAPGGEPPRHDEYFRLVHPDDRGEVRAAMDAAIHDGGEYHREFRVLWPDGSLHWIDGSARCFTDPNTGRWRLIGTAKEVTERKVVEAERTDLLRREQLARAEAERANLAKTSFLAVVSHELRTPLASIISFAELMDAEVGGPLTDAQRQHVERISTSAWHLTDLVSDILEFSRIESGMGELRMESFDAAHAVREVVQETAPQAAAKGLSLHFDEPGIAVTIKSDLRRFRQILLNLFSNAMKFTPHGEIRVEMEHEPEQVVVHVLDSGIGIAAEHQERIFEAFWQVESPFTRHIGGTGLGLAIAQRLARFLGGDLSVTSNPGAGSVFSLRLPRAHGETHQPSGGAIAEP